MLRSARLIPKYYKERPVGFAFDLKEGVSNWPTGLEKGFDEYCPIFLVSRLESAHLNASGHVRLREKAGHMICKRSDQKTARQPCEEGAIHIWLSLTPADGLDSRPSSSRVAMTS